MLKDWVTETKVTPWRSNTSTILAKSLSERVSRSTLYDDRVDLAVRDVGEQPLQCRPVQGAARDPAIVVHCRQRRPALVLLAGHIGLAGLALGIQRVEGVLQPLVRGLPRVDRTTHTRLSARPARQSWPQLSQGLASPRSDLLSVRRIEDPTIVRR